ncbi:MAG: patatin-like phospholipase family protein [Actinomycetota bacterium]|nr:patatin-like phospholipase family protein [Actinomycetota bacterium]
MGSVGLVLGGGGITGASYHLGCLLALEMATGWDPSEAAVVVGTSCGAFTAAMLRGGQLNIDTFIDDARSRTEATERLRARCYRRARPRGMVRWLRRGVLPGLTGIPDLRMVVGSPAMYTTDGIAEWIEERIGADMARSWPHRPTVIVGFDLATRTRAPFGTETAPAVAFKEAVAASVAVPMVYEPVQINGRWYSDGGIASGTSADLVLGLHQPLDLLIVIAPMAALDARPGARFYEGALDRVGRTALDIELARIAQRWPDTDIVVLRPDESILEVSRPNPMSTRAAIPAFLRTLRTMRDELSNPAVWSIIQRHLGTRQPVS